MYVHVGVATRVELGVTYIVPGKSEGNRSGLSHVATREGNHNGLCHSCLIAVPLHPRLLVVHHSSMRCFMHGWVVGHLIFFQSKHMYAYDLLYLSGVVSVPPAAGGTAP